MGWFSDVGKGAGSDAAQAAGEIVNDVQADMDKRWAEMLALIQGKRVRITIEVEDKEKP